jgi:hypothetical protein
MDVLKFPIDKYKYKNWILRDVVIYKSFWNIKVELDGSGFLDDLDTTVVWRDSKEITKEDVQKKVDKLKEAYDLYKSL